MADARRPTNLPSAEETAPVALLPLIDIVLIRSDGLNYIHQVSSEHH